jgi:hypothetical protein
MEQGGMPLEVRGALPFRLEAVGRLRIELVLLVAMERWKLMEITNDHD